MDTGKMLRAAVVACPDDYNVRLVYADWLDENGRHKRAATIRDMIAGTRSVLSGEIRAVIAEIENWYPQPEFPNYGFARGVARGGFLEEIEWVVNPGPGEREADRVPPIAWGELFHAHPIRRVSGPPVISQFGVVYEMGSDGVGTGVFPLVGGFRPEGVLYYLAPDPEERASAALSAAYLEYGRWCAREFSAPPVARR